MKTTVRLKGGYMGFHVSLGESKQLFGGEGGPEITGKKWQAVGGSWKRPGHTKSFF